MQPQKTKQTIVIEIANTITHGLGVGLAIAGLVLLIIRAAHTGSAIRIVSFTVYGSLLVLFYLASTMFHALVFTKAHHVFQVFDHSMIFLLIAGTYTPYCLVSIGGWQGWTLFGIIWAMAVCGVVYKSIWLNRVSIWSTVIYIIMGWLCLLAFKPLWTSLTPVGFFLLLSGGILFTLGALVYTKPNAYSHLIWHFFVLAGTITMYFSILFYV
ncbi:hemolysin III [Paucilactobacillus vaccinostercus DSM 20634]|jgi:hemolysin III|uniref:Hemolysin III n=1 Tax=Paucilactobacillus vaccinostercus DSM 20634 TaxID=1423813 RepID=A0A0R2A650_9LACO|nr:hemolysin III family protein [Paucilactobacillus vaccinostercus]KRM62525.1 hemolysin III [Paucilactobacillus vaccinostercus DSM 20634]RRG09695.1 MAG: hemolysin III family protein [Lactobacillus sp.]